MKNIQSLPNFDILPNTFKITLSITYVSISLPPYGEKHLNHFLFVYARMNFVYSHIKQ